MLRKLVGALALASVFNSTHAAPIVLDLNTLNLNLPEVEVGTARYSVVLHFDSDGRFSITSAAPLASAAADRSCSGGMTGFTFTLTMQPSAGTISVSMTGTTNTSLFAPHYISVIQGNNSVQGTESTFLTGILWTGDAGFVGGPVPTGVTKTGTFSRFPSWFDFNQPFVINSNITGEQFTC